VPSVDGHLVEKDFMKWMERHTAGRSSYTKGDNLIVFLGPKK
jgi:hypothetical protein